MRKTFFVVALSLVCVGVSGAADITIRSVPYEQPAPAPARVPVVAAKTVKVERVDSAAVVGACPCGHLLVCVGPKGGRYCVNSRGQKKYM